MSETRKLQFEVAEIKTQIHTLEGRLKTKETKLAMLRQGERIQRIVERGW